MKKLLLLLLLIPNLVVAEFKYALETLREEYVLKCSNLTKKEQREFKGQCEEYYKARRHICAGQSSNAKSDFAAKKMYETCLDRSGVPKK